MLRTPACEVILILMEKQATWPVSMRSWTK